MGKGGGIPRCFGFYNLEVKTDVHGQDTGAEHGGPASQRRERKIEKSAQGFPTKMSTGREKVRAWQLEQAELDGPRWKSQAFHLLNRA